MQRLRTRKSLVIFAIGVVLFASLVPVVSTLFTVVLTSLWLVIPAAVVVTLRRRAVRCTEQPVSLLSLVLSRAPPSLLALA
jgi:hypothetical protein